MVASIGKLYAKVNDYAQDNYYTKDAGLENSQWYGRGASILGLEGQVLTEDYNRGRAEIRVKKCKIALNPLLCLGLKIANGRLIAS